MRVVPVCLLLSTVELLFDLFLVQKLPADDAVHLCGK